MIFRWLQFRLKALRRHGVHSPFVYKYGVDILQKQRERYLPKTRDYSESLISAISYFKFEHIIFEKGAMGLQTLISKEQVVLSEMQASFGPLIVTKEWPQEIVYKKNYCILKGFKNQEQAKVMDKLSDHSYLLIHWDFTLLLYNPEFAVSQIFFLK